jgi:hypothetical protein
MRHRRRSPLLLESLRICPRPLPRPRQNRDRSPVCSRRSRVSHSRNLSIRHQSARNHVQFRKLISWSRSRQRILPRTRADSLSFLTHSLTINSKTGRSRIRVRMPHSSNRLENPHHLSLLRCSLAPANSRAFCRRLQIPLDRRICLPHKPRQDFLRLHPQRLRHLSHKVPANSHASFRMRRSARLRTNPEKVLLRPCHRRRHHFPPYRKSPLFLPIRRRARSRHEPRCPQRLLSKFRLRPRLQRHNRHRPHHRRRVSCNSISPCWSS